MRTSSKGVVLFGLAAMAGLTTSANAQRWRGVDVGFGGYLDEEILYRDEARDYYRGVFHPFTLDSFNAYVNGPIGDEPFVPEMRGGYQSNCLCEPTAWATLEIRDWMDDNAAFLDRLERARGSR